MSKLYNKYRIVKTDNTPTDPDAVYFVLRIDTDPAARVALLVYADHCGDDRLASELRILINKHNEILNRQEKA